MNNIYKVDQLGFLLAQIADLNLQADALKVKIKASGKTTLDGDYYHAAVSTSLRSKVDWKAVAEYLQPSRQLLAAHTTTDEVQSVRVTARLAHAAEGA